MTATVKGDARKRQVTLMLNQELVVRAQMLTDDIGGLVESLLADYVEYQRQQRMGKVGTLEATVAMWNGFNVRRGSIADEYSPL